ncbi:BT4734/BF3469 family protein [Spirosoma panaciterrae]|uniref:BT4734/BF3469 family protein n=1 Tax=Spirosoma panaciterrae TaxID=496058 RepID=UPI0003793E1A|nr:BT4734/BF3469 family protein [Spirosoma panaciterrae]
MKSILDVTVSCFANFKAAGNPQPVNLLQWLRSDKYANRVVNIRTIADKKERDALKATLPAITPSGQFTYREASSLVQHSGLICLDIDFKGNEQISNYNYLKKELSHIRNVAYCGLSVSGTGLFLLVPIAYPEQHVSQFNALQQLFKSHFSVRIDNTPDVARLRGYSFDAEGYYNHYATPFTGLYKAPVITRRSVPTITASDAGEILSHCIKLVETASEGQRHQQLLKAARLAGGFVAGGFIDENLVVETLETIVSKWPNFTKSRKTIRDGLSNGKQSPLHIDGWRCSQQYSTGYKSVVGTITKQYSNSGNMQRVSAAEVDLSPDIKAAEHSVGSNEYLSDIAATSTYNQDASVAPTRIKDQVNPPILTDDLPLTMTELALQRMNQRNPALQRLVETLDLVDKETGRSIRFTN